MTRSEDSDGIVVRDTLDNLRDDPGEVDPSAVRTVITDGSPDQREEAVEIVVGLANHDERVAAAIVDELTVALTHSETFDRIRAAAALAEIADTNPSVTTRAAKSLVETLSDDNGLARMHAVKALARQASHDPAPVLPAVAQLAELLDPERSLDVDPVVAIIAAIGESHPSELEPIVPSLIDFVEDHRDPPENDDGRGPSFDLDPNGPGTEPLSLNDQEDASRILQRQNAARAVARVAETEGCSIAVSLERLVNVFLTEYSNAVRTPLLDAILEAVDDHADSTAAIPHLAELLSADVDTETRARVAETLWHLSESYSGEIADALRADTDPLLQLLDADQQYVRGVAIGLLGHTAKHHPESVAPEAEPLARFLSSDEAFIKGGAIWALGFCGDESVVDAIESVEENTTDTELRETARQAIDRIESRSSTANDR